MDKEQILESIESLPILDLAKVLMKRALDNGFTGEESARMVSLYRRRKKIETFKGEYMDKAFADLISIDIELSQLYLKFGKYIFGIVYKEDE